VALLAETVDIVFRGDDPPAIRAVDRLHDAAVRLRASDIHLEPLRGGGRVRLRIDGVLREVERLSAELFVPVVSRVKLLAAMDIAERRLPQDGRYGIDRAGRRLDARVSSIPTIEGEKLVIRLLDLQAQIPDLDALGMPMPLAAQYRAAIHAAHGFVVVCGPTGSGKTTTLYASLAERNVEGQHLCSVEDPVEVQMAGVAQVQINPRAGLTFAGALRAFLRQDPNVIMLGEMRDAESASVAMSAALSGSLVMTTLHARDATRAIERLVELGLDRRTLAAGLSAVVAQRLVRRREADGYGARTAIFEVLPVNGAVASAIADGASADELGSIGASFGYVPIAEEAERLVRRGDTTREEIERVLGCGTFA
jgi:type II secretory ATPase GspE/PulE/Tfp pilus assembly ATPase PilB-like protein